ncbi:MAG TPA: peptidoglycan DD-metalloendopeptidase family protein [Anaerolineae bacterium]|nr:peptidoglycan DD-metalloendopeptidase family protein [Anaerolineae bacterium]HOR00876.1 peptidoglycan DD-metalloendopeptidase family protein [Anaerolineae bacterium]HPL29203.1 peptidoglycan DD-metalloendopeptidase family protein [Anaerolineae bacterium]
MKGHLRVQFLRWRYHALTLVLLLSGLGLVRAGLTYPIAPPATPMLRPVAASASDRGVRPVAPQSQPLGLLELPNTAALLSLTPAPTPIPIRTEVIPYTVVQGDTLLSIAERFNINLDTIIWANLRLELDPDLINIDDTLSILPVIGVWHTVQQGQTLEGIARYYKVTAEAITGYAPNKLAPGAPLTAGRKLIIPGGEKPFEAHVVQTEGGAAMVNDQPQQGLFIWPCSGVITTVYSKYHLAIDIANQAGTPVYAAASGTVVQAGELGTLGINVQIAHGNGFLTSSGHMQKIFVQEGQYVERGQQIGEMGSTGKSTGPHVHFIIRRGDGAVNPARYLPRQ